MNLEQSSRVPVSYPQPENDATMGNITDESFQGVYHQKDTKHIKENPWERLHDRATLASARRSFDHFEASVPADQLDFALKGRYDHHGELGKTSAEVLHQKETLNLPHRRVLKNRVKEVPPRDPAKCPAIECADQQKRSEHSIKGAISGHHTTETNQGFSRKQDGGFYTC